MTYPASRKYERYDPHDRTYKKWSIPEDWNGLGASGLGIRAHADGLPRFTQDEWVEMQKLRRRGCQINPDEMGDKWTNHGPKVYISLLCLCSWLTPNRDGTLSITISGATPTVKQRTFAKACLDGVEQTQ